MKRLARSAALSVMAGNSPSKDGRSSDRPMPGHPRRPAAPAFPALLARSAKPWGLGQPDHVDGRDKPGHDGKWHGKQDLTSLFNTSELSFVAIDAETKRKFRLRKRKLRLRTEKFRLRKKNVLLPRPQPLGIIGVRNRRFR